jgi:hypothetical protein
MTADRACISGRGKTTLGGISGKSVYAPCMAGIGCRAAAPGGGRAEGKRERGVVGRRVGRVLEG